MFMENLEVLEISKASDVSVVVSCGEGFEHVSGIVKGSENLGDDLLGDLDSYMDDINVRLTVSRMVSDSVIKGMINAIEQEAMEKIEMKELEVVKWMEIIHHCHACADEIESTRSPFRPSEQKIDNGHHSNASTNLVQLDMMKEYLGNLREAAKDHFKKLSKEISSMKGCTSLKLTSSELADKGDVVHEKMTERWIDVKKLLNSLKGTLDAIYNQVEKIVCTSKTSFLEWRQERDFQEEIKAMVVCSVVQGLQREFEGRLWDQNALFYERGKHMKQVEKMQEILNLRQELDAISKSISMPETGLTTHGSVVNGEEFNNAKRADVFHRKPSILEANGQSNSTTIMPENFEAGPLLHMSKTELITHFRTEISKMKIDHESQVQKMTEEYFSLKREYFKNRGYTLQVKDEKEFDTLRKKIPEILSNVDRILVESEKLSAFSNNTEHLDSLKNRLDTLLSENCMLRNLLMEKKKEIRYLSSQMSDAANRMSNLSFHEAKLHKTIRNLKDSVEDVHIEASITEDVCKCVISEVTRQISSKTEVSAAQNAESYTQGEVEDSNIQSIIIQDLWGVISNEAINDAKENVIILNSNLRNANEIQVSLELKVLEKEKALNIEVKEKERLNQEIILLEATMKEKEKMAVDAMAALANETDKLNFAYQELDQWRDFANHKDLLISENGKKLDGIKCRLVEALEQVDMYKVEVDKLNQRLAIVAEESREMDEERRRLLDVSKERQNTSLSPNAKEKKDKKLMDSVTVIVHGLAKEIADFESRIAEDIEFKSFRLENVGSQLSALVKKTNILRRTGLLYKKKLEMRCSDLQKAEAEVDLLGDEVEFLLSLLEKIYIALDHYSPILQHYPGIVEILKLVRRKLSGELIKPI